MRLTISADSSLVAQRLTQRLTQRDGAVFGGVVLIDMQITVEDVGICLGLALREALGDKRGIRRYGHFTLPMDETLVTVALDLSGRSFLVFQAPMPTAKIGDFDSELVEDFSPAAFLAEMREKHST